MQYCLQTKQKGGTSINGKKPDPLKIVLSCKVTNCKEIKKNVFLFSKLAVVWLKDVWTKKKMKYKKYRHI